VGVGWSAHQPAHLGRHDFVYDSVPDGVARAEGGVLAHEVQEDGGADAGPFADEAEEPALRRPHLPEPLLEVLAVVGLHALLELHDLFEVADGDLSVDAHQRPHLVEEEGGLRQGVAGVPEQAEEHGRGPDVLRQGHDPAPLDGRGHLREELEASTGRGHVHAVRRVRVAQLDDQLLDPPRVDLPVERDEQLAVNYLDAHDAPSGCSDVV